MIEVCDPGEATVLGDRVKGYSGAVGNVPHTGLSTTEFVSEKERKMFGCCNKLENIPVWILSCIVEARGLSDPSNNTDLELEGIFSCFGISNLLKQTTTYVNVMQQSAELNFGQYAECASVF